MASITKQLLSGSTNGRMTKVAATATPGTTIHTAIAGTTTIDEIFLWAVNSSAAAVKLTIEFGGTTSPDDTIEQFLNPEDGLVLVVPGFILNNTLLMKAFAGVANVVLVGGFVNRIIP